MGTLEIASDDDSDRQKWNRIFKAMVHMLQKQQTQLESLAKERKVMEERIKLQYDRWVADVNYFKGQIFEMKRVSTVREMERTVEAAKSDLILGLKQRDASFCKHKLDRAYSELEDFKALVDMLCGKCSELKTGENGEEQPSERLNSEQRMLMPEKEKLISKSSSEISALMCEKNFVWNQYNMMESNLTAQLRGKCTEVEQANGRVRKLLVSMDQMQSSNTEKDNTILTLKASVAKLETDAVKKTEEISRLSRELNLVKKSQNNYVTPLLRGCLTEIGNSQPETLKSGSVGKIASSDCTQILPRGSRKSSKRKAVGIVPMSESPKLFSSRFKVPKLKGLSPAAI